MNIKPVIILTSMIAAFAVQAIAQAEPAACPDGVPHAVEKKLFPVLHTLFIAKRKQDYLDKPYVAAFEKLLKAKDKDSREARVALMDYNVGDEHGPDLVCTVARDGKEMIPLLQLYNRCNIYSSDTILARRHQLHLRDYTLDILQSGSVEKECTFK